MIALTHAACRFVSKKPASQWFAGWLVICYPWNPFCHGNVIRPAISWGVSIGGILLGSYNWGGVPQIQSPTSTDRPF